MNRQTDADLAEVGVAVGDLDADAVPEGRQADVRRDTDVPAQAQDGAAACFAGAAKSIDFDVEASDPESAEEEEAAIGGRVEARADDEGSGGDGDAVLRPGPSVAEGAGGS